ncbi:MAG TPA: SLC13 family permease [Steroidobacteraceae bacterium]|jgi:di/tricarboxylate transporter
MTIQQILAVVVIAGMMALFVWGRLRYDLVAGLALLVCVLVGIVPFERAFTGFSDDIVIIVASALLVSAAVARSGIIEVFLQPLTSRISSVRAQLVVLVAAVTILSAFVKNIGALAMMIPIAFQMAKRSKTSPSYFLMPMAFGSLLGGLVTLIGTSPNIIVSRLRAELSGEPFRMFDFAPVGLGLSAMGLVFLAFAYRLLPRDRHAAPTLGEAIDITNYLTEARVGADSVILGQTIGALKQQSDQQVMVTTVVRDGQSATPLPDMVLRENDIVMLQGDPEALERTVARAGLELEGKDRTTRTEAINEEIGVIEAVIGPGSILVGQAAGRMALHERFNVNLLAVSRSGQRFTERLRDVELHAGDVIVLQGPLADMPSQLRELGCLPLAARRIGLGSVRRGLVPIAILILAMTLAATAVLPVGIAFFGAALLIVLSGSLSLREAYETVDWPILIMLGALIPVSETIRTTGDADLIARALSNVAHGLPPYGAVALILVTAMALTPFLNNAATVLVMAPIAASFASNLGFRPDAFLMAVAVGAGCDFLTPIGHQCNTLVMGPGGYKFGDYARLGAPLSVLIVLLGVPLIMMVWPV